MNENKRIIGNCLKHAWAKFEADHENFSNDSFVFVPKFQTIDRADAIDLVQTSSKSELSSRLFGRLQNFEKFSNSFFLISILAYTGRFHSNLLRIPTTISNAENIHHSSLVL